MYDKGIRHKSINIWVFYAIAKKWALKEKKEKLFVPGAIPAYTLSELGEMFPYGSFSMQPVIKINNGLWTVPKNVKSKVSFETEVDARAYHLLRLIETGEVSINQINNVIVKSNPILSGQESPEPNDDNLSAIKP